MFGNQRSPAREKILFLCFESLVSAYHAGDEYTRSNEVVEVVDGAPPDVDLETFEGLAKSFV